MSCFLGGVLPFAIGELVNGLRAAGLFLRVSPMCLGFFAAHDDGRFVRVTNTEGVTCYFRLLFFEFRCYFTCLLCFVWSLLRVGEGRKRTLGRKMSTGKLIA